MSRSVSTKRTCIIHVETGGNGAVGVDGGLYGINGREVSGRALLDAISAGKMKRNDTIGYDMKGCSYLCSQPPRLGLEFRRYSIQEGDSSPEPAVYSKHIFEATLKASAQSQTRRGTPPLHPLFGGILSQAMISW